MLLIKARVQLLHSLLRKYTRITAIIAVDNGFKIKRFAVSGKVSFGMHIFLELNIFVSTCL